MKIIKISLILLFLTLLQKALTPQSQPHYYLSTTATATPVHQSNTNLTSTKYITHPKFMPQTYKYIPKSYTHEREGYKNANHTQIPPNKNQTTTSSIRPSPNHTPTIKRKPTTPTLPTIPSPEKLVAYCQPQGNEVSKQHIQSLEAVQDLESCSEGRNDEDWNDSAWNAYNDQAYDNLGAMKGPTKGVKINAKLGGLNSLLDVEHSLSIPHNFNIPTMNFSMNVWYNMLHQDEFTYPFLKGSVLSNQATRTLLLPQMIEELSGDIASAII